MPRLPKELLTATDVGVALGVSAARVHQLIRGGLMPAIRVGSRGVRIPRAAFEGWLLEKNQQATQSVNREAQNATA